MPDQNDQHAQALIEALAPKLIEAILPKIAESVEAQIGGIKKKNDERDATDACRPEASTGTCRPGTAACAADDEVRPRQRDEARSKALALPAS